MENMVRRMLKSRGIFYNALLLGPVLLGAVGCGQPAAPPPGAPKEYNPASIELGPQTTDNPPAGAAPATSDGQTPPAQTGDTK